MNMHEDREALTCSGEKVNAAQYFKFSVWPNLWYIIYRVCAVSEISSQ